MKLTKELYESIEKDCENFNKEPGNFYDVNVNDVLFSYLYSTEDDFFILNDWNEGRNNDPFWNDELNEHSVIVFLGQACKNIKIKL